MMDYSLLISELQTDPLNRGYASKTVAQVIESMYAFNRPTQRGVVDSHEVIEATVDTEYELLTAAQKQRYQTIVSAGRVNLKGENTRKMLGSMFPANSVTRANLLALQLGPMTNRVTELGLQGLGDGHVISARAQINGG